MKVGDLVRLKGEWVTRNPWMRGTLLDDSPETLGVIVKVTAERINKCGEIYKIEWMDGKRSEVSAIKLEAVCK